MILLRLPLRLTSCANKFAIMRLMVLIVRGEMLSMMSDVIMSIWGDFPCSVLLWKDIPQGFRICKTNLIQNTGITQFWTYKTTNLQIVLNTWILRFSFSLNTVKAICRLLKLTEITCASCVAPIINSSPICKWIKCRHHNHKYDTSLNPFMFVMYELTLVLDLSCIKMLDNTGLSSEAIQLSFTACTDRQYKAMTSGLQRVFVIVEVLKWKLILKPLQSDSSSYSSQKHEN